MKYSRVLKLAVFLAVVAVCFALDAGLGMFGSALLLGTLGVAGGEAEAEGGEAKAPPIPKMENVADEQVINTLVQNKVQEATDGFKSDILVLKNKIETAESLFRMNAPETPKEKNEFANVIKNGLLGMYKNKPELITNTFLNETTDSQGKYTVPAEWYGAILDKTQEFSTIMRNAQIYNMSGKTLELVKTSTVPSWSFDTAEGAARAVSNATFAKIILERKDGGFIVLFSKRLLEDSAFDLTSLVTMLAGKAFANAIETAGYTGDSGASITGLLEAGSGTTNVELDTGSTAFSDVIYDKIIEMVDAIPSTELANAKFYMNRTIWNKVKTLKFDKTYAVSPEDRKNKMLEGFPIELTDKSYALSASAANKKFITFGDLKNMALGMRNGLSFEFAKEGTVVEGETTYNLFQMGLIALKFDGAFDIDYTHADAIATLKTNDV